MIIILNLKQLVIRNTIAELYSDPSGILCESKRQFKNVIGELLELGFTIDPDHTIEPSNDVVVVQTTSERTIQVFGVLLSNGMVQYKSFMRQLKRLYKKSNLDKYYTKEMFFDILDQVFGRGTTIVVRIKNHDEDRTLTKILKAFNIDRNVLQDDFSRDGSSYNYYFKRLGSSGGGYHVRTIHLKTLLFILSLYNVYI